MAMSHRDRFKLKSQLVEAFEDDAWPWARINLLFGELGLEALDDGYYGASVGDRLGTVSDSTLAELYTIVFDVSEQEVAGAVEAGEGTAAWKPGYVRLFVSHSAHHRDFVGEVADELAVVGIHGFVAHDAMEYTKPWQEQIETALKSMQAFVALVHPEFTTSSWCNQEVGWALGRRVPRYAVRLGTDPAGFIASHQWPSGFERSPREVAQQIYAWVAGIPELGPSIVDGLLKSLSEAGNYFSAGAAAQRIVSLGGLSDAEFTRLDEIYWKNDQVRGAHLATRELKPFYERHGKAWPPGQPPAPRLAIDPWATSCFASEAPF